MKAGLIENTIYQLKDGKWGWGLVFSRIILGYLAYNPEVVNGIDAIIPMPAYLPTGDRRQDGDHAGWVIQNAVDQDEYGLPFVLEPPLIVKQEQTGQMRTTTSFGQRQMLALGPLLRSLHIPDTKTVQGKNIMVYDDVLTSGNTLNAVATKLVGAGAAGVWGLALARQPWASR